MVVCLLNYSPDLTLLSAQASILITLSTQICMFSERVLILDIKIQMLISQELFLNFQRMFNFLKILTSFDFWRQAELGF